MSSDQQKTRAGLALGECVRAARKRAGLRQEELARSAGIGTSTLRQIESGAATGTSIFIVFRLLEAAGAELSALTAVFSEFDAGTNPRAGRTNAKR